ncbi:hypothetical protein Tco_1124617 [Tanacetum coccineum]|uniref:Uncharacterized protein n=1 Tax=Tanacetum coccineum TaxID=301880 RepID=A0ABQ5J6M3_9ASTR
MYDQTNIKDATSNSAMSSSAVPSEEGVTENKNVCLEVELFDLDSTSNSAMSKAGPSEKVIEKLSQEKVSQQEALEKFKWKVVRDDEIKVLGEVNVELESGTKKRERSLAMKKILKNMLLKSLVRH